MTTFAPILASEYTPDAPMTASLGARWSNNLLAAFEGDVSARNAGVVLNLKALQRLTAGNTVKLRDDNEVSGSNTSYSTIFTFRVLQSGEIRIEARHKASTSGVTSDLRIVRWRGGSSSVINEWSTSSTTYVQRSHDTNIQPGDMFNIQQKISTGTQNTFCDNRRILCLLTDNFWPAGCDGASIPLENNDYS